MSVLALDDVRPDAPEQLVLDPEVFGSLVSLAEAQAITLSAFMLDERVTYDTAEALGAFFGTVNRAVQWWIGDLLVYAEGSFGETYAQIAAATGLSEQTLLRRMHVCKQIPPERRVASLSFSTHAVVANLPAKEQTAWLKRAAKAGWNASELRAQMRSARSETAPPLPGTGEPDDGGGVIVSLLEEVARRIVKDAKPTDDPSVVAVPVEDIVRLKAALGEHEE